MAKQSVNRVSNQKQPITNPRLLLNALRDGIKDGPWLKLKMFPNGFVRENNIVFRVTFTDVSAASTSVDDDNCDLAQETTRQLIAPFGATLDESYVNQRNTVTFTIRPHIGRVAKNKKALVATA